MKFRHGLWFRADVEPMAYLFGTATVVAISFFLIYLPHWDELTQNKTGIQFLLIIMGIFIWMICFSAVALTILWRNYQRASPVLYPETVRLMEGVLNSASLPFEATVKAAKSRFKSKVIFFVPSLNMRIKIGGQEKPNRMVGAISWIVFDRVRDSNKKAAFELMESIDHAYVPSALVDRNRVASTNPKAGYIVPTGKVGTEEYWQSPRIFAYIYLAFFALLFGSFLYLFLRFFDFITSPEGVGEFVVISVTFLGPSAFLSVEGVTLLVRHGTSLSRSIPLSYRDVIRIVELSLAKQGIGYSLGREKRDITFLMKPKRTFILEKWGATISVFGRKYPSSFILISGFSSRHEEEMKGVLRSIDDMLSPSM